MNKLKGQRCYLAGAIDRCPEMGKGWRDEITSKLKELGCIIVDPLNSPIVNQSYNEPQSLKNRHILVEQHRYDEVKEIVKQIRSDDLRLTDISDFCICYIDLDIFMCGSFEEISWMNRSKKPVLIVTKQGKSKTPLWLFGQFPHEHMFGSFEDMFNYLDDVDQDNIGHKRFVFHTL